MKVLFPLLLVTGLLACKVSNHETSATENQDDASSVRQAKNKGIVYFSANDGAFWQNKSKGLPDGIFLTDLATEGNLLALSTKQHGIFLYDFASDSWQKTSLQPPTGKDIDDLLIHDGKIWAGTQNDGVFISDNQGKSWKTLNEGLQNLTIRRLAFVDKQVWACTNQGLYVFRQNKWELIPGHPALQTNGITGFDGELYTGTTRGIFRNSGKGEQWKAVLPGKSLHNINSIGRNIYAMIYGDLMMSADKGTTWKNIQEGLPKGLYTFHIVRSHQTILAGQWDGVYKMTASQTWLKSGNGLPAKFASIEMVVFKDQIITASSGWLE